jgi:hypothetical protein
MVFGEQYGLGIESLCGKGTRIILSMPDVPNKLQI